MKKVLLALVALFGVLVLAAGAFLLWAGSAAADRLAVTYEVHDSDFPVPVPLTEAEVAELRAEAQAKLDAAQAADGDGDGGDGDGDGGAAKAKGKAGDGDGDGDGEGDGSGDAPDPLANVDLDAIALQRAQERGRHLMESRYACSACHGQDLSGGVMVDDPALGAFLGSNLTTGEGGTDGFTFADWDRKVRHGVSRDGKGGLMPSVDYIAMSNQELSDLIAWIRTMPPVDNVVPALTLGPVGKILVAKKIVEVAAEDHAATGDHEDLPPETAPNAEFGAHIAGVCTGCHRPGFEGGPIKSGDPAWPPAPNLTPGGDAAAGYDLASFDRVMRTGVRPDGTPVAAPMNELMPYTGKMTEVEMKALWAFVSGLEAKSTGT